MGEFVVSEIRAKPDPREAPGQNCSRSLVGVESPLGSVLWDCKSDPEFKSPDPRAECEPIHSAPFPRVRRAVVELSGDEGREGRDASRGREARA